MSVLRQVLFKRLAAAPTVNVEVDALCNTTDVTLLAHVAENGKRDLPWLTEEPANKHVAVMVGGGASIHGMVDELRGRIKEGQYLFALNGAAHWLKTHDIIPDWQVIIDARREMFRHLINYPARSYAIASQCHPYLFDFLAGRHIVMFHTAIEGAEERLPATRKRTLIGTYGTVGLAAICAAYTAGFREIHLYGYDSSDAEDKAHAYEQPETEGEKARLDVVCAGRRFRASFAMYKQAEQFPYLAQKLADGGCTVAVHGDGLLPTVAREMVRPEVI